MYEVFSRNQTFCDKWKKSGTDNAYLGDVLGKFVCMNSCTMIVFVDELSLKSAFSEESLRFLMNFGAKPSVTNFHFDCLIMSLCEYFDSNSACRNLSYSL